MIRNKFAELLAAELAEPAAITPDQATIDLLYAYCNVIHNAVTRGGTPGTIVHDVDLANVHANIHRARSTLDTIQRLVTELYDRK